MRTIILCAVLLSGAPLVARAQQASQAPPPVGRVQVPALHRSSHAFTNRKARGSIFAAPAARAASRPTGRQLRARSAKPVAPNAKR